MPAGPRNAVHAPGSNGSEAMPARRMDVSRGAYEGGGETGRARAMAHAGASRNFTRRANCGDPGATGTTARSNWPKALATDGFPVVNRQMVGTCVLRIPTFPALRAHPPTNEPAAPARRRRRKTPPSPGCECPTADAPPRELPVRLPSCGAPCFRSNRAIACVNPALSASPGAVAATGFRGTQEGRTGPARCACGSTGQAGRGDRRGRAPAARRSSQIGSAATRPCLTPGPAASEHGALLA